MKKNKKNQKVEIIEEYQNGMIISRKINGVDVPISSMERNFVKFNKMSFEEVKSIFGEQKDL